MSRRRIREVRHFLFLGLLMPSCDSFIMPRLHSNLRNLGQLHSLPTRLDIATSGLASMARLMAGVKAEGGLRKEDTGENRTLTLWDCEHDSGCRAVREEITRLDLCVVVHPCAVGSKHWAELSDGGAAVPCLADSKAGAVFHGSESVLTYLRSEYGTFASPESPPAVLSLVASALRFYRGAVVSPAASGAPRPEQPLVLYNYEGNQFCRLVREVLAELDCVYEVRSAGKGSPRREAEMVPLTRGSSQCPYLVDPNTGVEMAESLDIISYLYRTYALWTPPSELLRNFDGLTSVLKPVFALQARAQAMAQASAEKRATTMDEQHGYDGDGIVQQTLEDVIASAPVVVFTYELSPFCLEATSLLRGLGVAFKEISLGREWAPGFISEEGGAIKRAVLLDMTGQSSLPQIFVGGKPLGGLFSGTPGLLPALEAGVFSQLISDAATSTSAVE